MKKTLAYMAALSVVAVSAQAAIITWGAATDLAGGDGTLDMYTVGTVIGALNVNGSDITVAGIDFTSSSTAIVIGGGAGYNDFQDANPTPSLDADYNTLLDPGTYALSSIGLYGLTIGEQYAIQIWSSDSRSFITGRTTDFVAGNSVTLAEGDGTNLGQWVVGIFTADAANQDISVSSPDDNGSGALVNAVQIRAIPEPATLGLVGTFAAGMLFIRRRFMI